MKRIISVLLVISCTGCSGFQFNSNLGDYATGRIKSAAVEEYSFEEINRFDAVSLGFVEASYCQERPDERRPSKAALINELKLATHRRGGNGVVVEACSNPSTDGLCQSYVECRGVAYAVPERQSRP